MSHANPLVDFLRHYGPIAASDNMYDELIQSEIERHGIEPPVEIRPARLQQIIENFESTFPKSVILTGTAGDGKTYHCRRIFSHFDGQSQAWHQGDKLSYIPLPGVDRQLCIVKDLSELTVDEKSELMPKLAAAVAGQNEDTVYLVAANDGQLLASWRDWAEPLQGEKYKHFKIIEEMLVGHLDF